MRPAMTDTLAPTLAWAIAPAPVPSAQVSGSDARFPIRRVFCLGRNYALHVKEMGGDPKAEAPLFFTKPADAVVSEGGDVPYPTATSDLHHEVELVLAIGGEGENLDASGADALIWGWAVGVDLTRRDLQAEAKKGGKPWDAAKAFDASAPLGAITPRIKLADARGSIRLTVNGRTAQEADLSDMIWKPAEIVAAASRLWRLKPGDLIFTGTPEGVGPLVRGDKVEASIEGLTPLAFRIV